MDWCRELVEEDLQAALGVLAQFELRPGAELARAPVAENLDPGDGVRRASTAFQIGLEDVPLALATSSCQFVFCVEPGMRRFPTEGRASRRGVPP